jgi:hypothetical protein
MYVYQTGYCLYLIFVHTFIQRLKFSSFLGGRCSDDRLVLLNSVGEHTFSNFRRNMWPPSSWWLNTLKWLQNRFEEMSLLCKQAALPSADSSYRAAVSKAVVLKVRPLVA